MNREQLILVMLSSLLWTPKPDEVQKAEPPVISGLVVKAWTPTGSEDTFFEGWISTEKRDKQKDIVPPETFEGVIEEYMAVGAPLSSEHNMDDIPIGHIQKAALVRDGRIFKEATHPLDPADFQFFPGVGTGVFGRGVVTEPGHARAILKANIGGMSWTGDAEGIPLPGGGRKFTKVITWAESTLAAYPVNPDARIIATKAQ